MKLLIAEDDPFFRQLFIRLLSSEYELVLASDGGEAWNLFQQDDDLRLAILDWLMPIMDGPELCRRLRSTPGLEGVYVLIATTKQNINDVVEALKSGADDFITKPFHAQELIARLRVGGRVIELQSDLAHRVQELQEALHNVKLLQGLLPICSYCKRIRDERDQWQPVDTYVSEHTEAQFSHGVCPNCYSKFIVPELDQARKKRQ